MISTSQLPSRSRASLHLLDQYHQTSTRSAPSLATPRWPWPVCPRKGTLVWRSKRTGWLVPGMCGSLRCWACVVPVALRYAAAIALAQPEHGFTVTLVGDAWPEINRRMNRFHARLRTTGLPIQNVYMIERNPRGTGNHAHCWAWGAPLTLETVNSAAGTAGMGAVTWLEPWSTPVGTMPLVKYGMKAVTNRPTAARDWWPAAKEFMALNNNRLVHNTRGFWRDGSTGEVFPGVRPAIRHVRQAAGRGGEYRAVAIAEPPVTTQAAA